MRGVPDLKGFNLIWTTARGSSFWGLHGLFGESIVVCVDDSPEFDGAGVDFLTHEGPLRRRVNWTTESVDLLEEVWRNTGNLVRDPGWIVVAPLGCPSAAAWCERFGGVLRSRPASTSGLDGKRVLRTLVEDLGLPSLPGEWITPESRRFHDLSSAYGTRFVAQAAEGQGGSGTVFLSTDGEWEETVKRFAGQPMWITPFAGDLSLNINAIALPGASRAGYPSVQLTGLPYLHAPDGAYCGNDFHAAAALPAALLHSVREQTERIGNAIAQRGYRGLFGLDLVVDDRTGAAYIVDLNARGQGSTPLHTQLEHCAGRTPLPVITLLLEAGVIEPEHALSAASGCFEPLAGAQVRYRYGGPAQALQDPPRPGAYSRQGVWLRPARLMEEIGTDEALLTGGPPRSGTVVETGSQLFRICTHGGMLSPGSSTRTEPWVEALINTVFPPAVTANSDRQ